MSIKVVNSDSFKHCLSCLNHPKMHSCRINISNLEFNLCQNCARRLVIEIKEWKMGLPLSDEIVAEIKRVCSKEIA